MTTTDHIPPPATVEEVARALDVSPTSARRWLATGRIPGAIRPGRRWLLPRPILDQLLRGSSSEETDR